MKTVNCYDADIKTFKMASCTFTCLPDKSVFTGRPILVRFPVAPAGAGVSTRGPLPVSAAGSPLPHNWADQKCVKLNLGR